MDSHAEGVSQASADVLALANRCVDQIEELATALRHSSRNLQAYESVVGRADPELAAAAAVLDGAIALLGPVERLGSLQNRHKIRDATKVVADSISLAQAHIQRARIEFDSSADA